MYGVIPVDGMHPMDRVVGSMGQNGKEKRINNDKWEDEELAYKTGHRGFLIFCGYRNMDRGFPKYAIKRQDQ